MFKKFVQEEQVSGSTQVKSSVARAIKARATETMPGIEDVIDDLMPKKSGLTEIKCKDHVKMYMVGGEVLFFQQRDGPLYPTLKLLHKYPNLLPRQQVDAGAIKFVLSGAHIMCPGLTSPGAKMVEASEDTPVGIFAEGKKHALAIGIMKMSSADIASKNKGIGVEVVHYLNDGLWHTKNL